MASPNIINVASIIGKTDVQNTTTTTTVVTLNPASSNTVYKINSVILSNINGVNDVGANIYFFKSAVSYAIAYKVTIPAGASLVAVTKDMGIYLEEGDSIRCDATVNSYVQTICSYEIIS